MSQFQKAVFEQYEVKDKKEIVDLEILGQISKIIAGNKHAKILEVGCGGGQLLEPITSKADVYGIDISEMALEHASAKGYKTSVVNLESDSFPFEDGYFDIVVMNDVLEHITCEDKCLREIWRVLGSNGRDILGVPNVSTPTSWFMQLFMDLPPMMSARYKSPHVRDYTMRMIRVVMKVNGFKIEKSKGTFIYPFRHKVSRFFADRIVRFSERIIVVCSKSHLPVQSEDIVFDVRKVMEQYED